MNWSNLWNRLNQAELLKWLNCTLFGIVSLIAIYLAIKYWYVSAVVLPVLLLPLCVYFLLCFTIVPDGQAKRVDRFGAFLCIILQWNGHSLDPEGDVTDIAAKSFLGGFRFVSWLKPLGFDKVYVTPEFKYSKIESVGGKQTVVPHTLTNLDYILVKPDVFGIMVEKEETSASTGERIPINVMLAVGVRVVNPEKVLTQAPTNWWEKTEARFVSMVRGWIAATLLDDILSTKGSSDAMMAIINLLDPDFISRLEEDWGIRIEKIELVDVDLPPEYQEAAGAKRRQEMQASGFAASTAGAELAMVSSMSGIPLQDLQKKIKDGIDAAVVADPVHGLENWIRANPKYWDLIQKKELGIKPVLFGNADGSSFDPLTGALAALISLAKGQGGGVQQGNPSVGTPSNTPKPKGNPSGGNPANPVPDPVAEAQAVKAADKCFKQYGVYPKWDPLKRTPN